MACSSVHALYRSTAPSPLAKGMTRASATLTLFLSLPQGSMSFVSSISSCRPRVALPKMQLSGAPGRAMSSSSHSQRHLRRRRSDYLVASVSTSEDVSAEGVAGLELSAFDATTWYKISSFSQGPVILRPTADVRLSNSSEVGCLGESRQSRPP